MLVSLAELKSVLKIAEDDHTSDDQLTRLIKSATMWIEGYTHRRFSSPAARIEYRQGTDSDCLILRGHIDDEDVPDSGSDDPSTSLEVASRSLPRSSNDTWTVMEENTEWERRQDILIAIGGWGIWTCTLEYRLSYLDGYFNAPDDIKAVLFEMATNQRAMELAVISGSAGITSESLGDYSWSADLKEIGAGGNGLLGQTSMWTLNGYKRMLVG